MEIVEAFDFAVHLSPSSAASRHLLPREKALMPDAPAPSPSGEGGPKGRVRGRSRRRQNTAVVLARMQIHDLLLDFLIHLVDREIVRDPDRALDRLRVRAAVADHASASHTQ